MSKSLAKKLICEKETGEMSFDDVVKYCIELDLNSMVEGLSLHRRIHRLCMFTAEWRKDRDAYEKKQIELDSVR